MYTMQFVEEVLKTYQENHSQKLTAKQFNIGKTTVSEWSQMYIKDGVINVENGNRKSNDEMIQVMQIKKEDFVKIDLTQSEDTEMTSFDLDDHQIKISVENLKQFIEH